MFTNLYIIICDLGFVQFYAISYHKVKAAHSGSPGRLAAADITTLIYTLPPRKGALNDIPQLTNDTANLFSGYNKKKDIFQRYHVSPEEYDG